MAEHFFLKKPTAHGKKTLQRDRFTRSALDSYRNGRLCDAEFSRRFTNAVRLFGKKEYRKAEGLLRDILETNPNDVGASCLLIRVYSETEELEKARKVFAEAIGNGSRSPNIYNSLIGAHKRNKQPELAEEIFGIALKDGVADEGTYMAITRLYYTQRRFRDIETTIKNAPISIRNEYCVQLMLAETMRKLKRKDEAIKICNSVIESAKNGGRPEKKRCSKAPWIVGGVEACFRARLIKAYCLMENGGLGTARDEFNRLMGEIPDSLPSEQGRAICGAVFSCSYPKGTELELERRINELIRRGVKNRDFGTALMLLEKRRNGHSSVHR